MVVFLNFLRLLQSFNRLKISHLIEFIELLQGFAIREGIIQGVTHCDCGIFDPIVEGEEGGDGCWLFS